MSGTAAGANLPINIRLNGAAEAEAAFNRVGTTAGTAMQRVAQSTDQASASGGRLRQVMGQAGFQVQDFATQVSMGQNALMAFGVQASQLAGVLGPTGAIAGAGLMIGVIAAQLLTMGESASQAEARIKASFDGIKADSEGVRDVIKEIGDLYKTAAERAQDLARAQRNVLSQNVDLRLSTAIQTQDAAASRIPQLETEIARLERRAQVEADIARRSSRGGLGAPVDQTTDTTSALFVARSQLNGMRAEMDLMSRRIGELNTARGRLENAGNDQGFGQYSPGVPLPQAERARASTERLSDAAREYQQIMREAEAQVTRTLTEEERRANTLDRLSQMLAQGEISGDQYVAGVEAQRQAVQAVREEEDRRASERSAQEARRTAQRAAEQIERDNKSTTDSIVRYGADRFADMFSENSRGWAGMLETFKSTARSVFARIAAEAIIRPIIAPIVQGLGLGQLGSAGGSGFNLGGLFGGGSAQAAQPTAGGGSLTDSLGSFGTLRQAYNGFTSPGGLGSFFPGGAAVNTGFGGLDGFLNTALYTPGTTGAATGSGFFAGTSMAGEAGAFIGGGGAAQSLTLAGSLGPLAAIGGGAYGIYSGIQKGGVGGALGAAGGAVSTVTGLGMLGAAAGLLPALGVLGPIGLGIGAVLAIAGALMPGAKPSGMGQLARTNLNTGLETTQGLGGKRYSEANASAAGSTVDGIVNLAREIGDRLGGARIGGDVAAGVTNGDIYLDINGQKTRAANTEQGAKDIAAAAARMVLNEFNGQGVVQGDYRGIVAASGDNLEKLDANLQWYEKVYKTFGESVAPVSAFQQSLESVNVSMNALIDKAHELGLSSDRLVEARAREVAKVIAQRDAQVRSFDMGLEIRGLRLAGNNEYADIMSFNAQALVDLAKAKTELETLGLNADEVAQRIATAEAILGAERLQIVQQYADQRAAIEKQAADEQLRLAQQTASAQVDSARTILDYLNSQSLGSLSSLSPTARLAEAERQFQSAVSSGDASQLTGAADALLSNSRDVFGGATQIYAQREAAVRQVLINRGNAATWGNGDGATIAALSQMTTALTAELAALRTSFAELVAETRRANNQAMVA